MNRMLTRLLVPLCLLLSLTAARAAEFTSTHFRYTYNAQQLGRDGADRAAQDAERAYADNEEWFPGSGPSLIRCDLTPRFFGATGYAQPERRPPVVAVRIPDLEYLGLDQAYVLRHEVAHVFSGRLASGPLGEGLADLVAASTGDLPLAPWWGGTLREAGLWVDPEALFITGDYSASAELDARQRAAVYTEPALLLQYLSGRYGFERVLRFLPDYSRARRTIQSNDAASRGRGFRRPDPAAARRSFQQHFGRSWSDMLADWEAKMGEGKAPPEEQRRLVLRQKTYAAIRNFEMWLLAQRGSASSDRAAAIRQAFTRVNAALRARRLDEAEAGLRAAQGMVNDLKRPMMITDATLGLWRASY
jgi:hypothetical protein